jgi:hypothetical protein
MCESRSPQGEGEGVNRVRRGHLVPEATRTLTERFNALAADRHCAFAHGPLPLRQSLRWLPRFESVWPQATSFSDNSPDRRENAPNA